ncbi:MAG: hypothetical protein ABL874_03040 [Sphingopyxis sp.]
MSKTICTACGHSNDGAVSGCAECDAPLDAVGGDWVGLVEKGRSDPPGGELAELEREVKANADDRAQEEAPLFPGHDAPEPPPRKSLLWPLLLIGAIIAALIGGYFGWTMFGQGPQMAEVAGDGEPKQALPADGRPAWQAGYADVFLAPDTVIMVVAADAKQRDFPSTDGTAVARERREGEMVSGRWVRGADGTSRWLKLSDGGYVWDGNLAVAGGPGSPIAISFSNRDTSFGPEIGRYLEQASAIIERRYARADSLPPKEQAAYLESIETDAAFVRVPNRRFHGLTIIAVAQFYEGSGIIFRESEAIVIAALREAGIVINDGGAIPLSGDHEDSCSVSVFAPEAGEPQNGASQLSCGL